MGGGDSVVSVGGGVIASIGVFLLGSSVEYFVRLLDTESLIQVEFKTKSNKFTPF